MKRLGLVLSILGAVVMGGGIVFSLLMGLSTCGEACVKSRLDSVLKARGYIVRWDVGTYEYVPLYFREQLERVERGELENIPREQIGERLRQARVIHFMEVEAGKYFFFFEKPFFLAPHVEVSKVEEGLKADEHSFNPQDAGLVHIHNGSFRVLVLGKLILSEEEIENSFPFEEVKDIATWQNETRRRVRRYSTLLGMVFLLFGGGTIGFLRLPLLYRKQPQPQPIGMGVMLSTQKRESIAIVETTLSSGGIEIVREETLDIERMRRQFSQEISVMIDQSEGEQKALLMSIHALLAKEEARPSKLEYQFARAKKLFFGLMEEEEAAQGVPREEEEIETFSDPREIDFKSKEALDKLLPIDDFVPKALNLACIREILWFLLRNHLFGDNFRHHQFPRKSVLEKGFPPEEWEACFGWLVKRGVILHRKRHGGRDFVCSLNPDLGSAQSPGSEIIRVVVRARQLLAKR